MEGQARSIIESLGVYLPPKTVATKDILRACRHELLLPLERLTGISFRRMAGDTEFSIDLAKQAISNCLEHSKYGPDDVELIICCNISRLDGPNFQYSFEPSTSVRLKKHFGFKNALAFDISNACAGMFTGINVADSFIKAGLVRRALVVSGEYITHLTKTAQQEIKSRDDSRFACLTLGDSGAAVMLEPTADQEVGFHAVDMYTLGKFSEYCIARVSFEKHGGAIMFTESMKLHAVGVKESAKHVVHLLAQLDWPKRAIESVIMHQFAKNAFGQIAKMINAVRRDDLCNSENMINNLAERGNTSTTTHFVALWDNIMNGRIKSGDNVLFSIQASGLTIGTAPYTFDDLPDRMRRSDVKAAAVIPPAEAVTVQQPEKRVRIESVGTIPAGLDVAADAIELSRVAAEDCLDRSAYEREDIGLLIHSGVHRNDFVCEPALAAMIAGKLHVNEESAPQDPKTFAYDVFNGAVGFLNACYNAIAMIKASKCERAMVVASEVENNAGVKPGELLGVKETGSALILDESADGNSGFGSFIFRTFTDYIDSFSSSIGQEKGINFLRFMRSPNIENIYLDCIADAVTDILKKEGLEPSQIAAVFPPQISSGFIARLRERLDLLKDNFVDIAQDGKDLFTSSLPYTLRSAREQELVQTGDIGLIINVGSGVQVGCAIYYF